MEKALKLSDQNFDETVLKSPVPVLIDFWASWCAPCLMVAPSIEELAGEYDGRFLVAKLNVDANPLIPKKYKITSIPTLLFFKEGEIVDKVLGAYGKETIAKKMDALL